MVHVMEYVQLSSGHMMPKVGLGLWTGGDTTDIGAATDTALEVGYRLFDTAYIYGTEDVLGKSIKKWIAAGQGKREDIFVTTKLPWNGMQPNMVPHFLDQSLCQLDLCYVDLYLIHWPIGVIYRGNRDFLPTLPDGSHDLDFTTDLESIWAAMEAQVDAGKARAIGISNFTKEQTQRILKMSRIPPVVNQVEVQVYMQQKELIDFCVQNCVVVTAYSPLGAPWRKTFGLYKTTFQSDLPQACNLLEDKVVKEIAGKHGKTSAQVLLKYLLSIGCSLVAKSSNRDRLQENIDLFRFNLDATDMLKLEQLDKGEAGRTGYPPMKNHSKHPECPFATSLY